MCMGGGGGDAAAYARQQQQASEQRVQQGLGNINNAFSSFTPGFYQQRADDYMRFALPQLNMQAQQQQRGLGYDLASRGLTHSSAGQRLQSTLAQNIDAQKAGLVSEGNRQAQSLQQTVAQQRSNLVGQLEASSDPQAASQNALASAQSFSAPSSYAPIGNLFTNWSNIYAANSLANTPGYVPGGFGSMFNNQSRGTGYSAPITLRG